jgi:hypothetical protein
MSQDGEISWHLLQDGGQTGPFSTEEVRRRVAMGTLPPEAWARSATQAQWLPIARIVALGGTELPPVPRTPFPATRRLPLKPTSLREEVRRLWPSVVTLSFLFGLVWARVLPAVFAPPGFRYVPGPFLVHTLPRALGGAAGVVLLSLMFTASAYVGSILLKKRLPPRQLATIFIAIWILSMLGNVVGAYLRISAGSLPGW